MTLKPTNYPRAQKRTEDVPLFSKARKKYDTNNMTQNMTEIIPPTPPNTSGQSYL